MRNRHYLLDDVREYQAPRFARQAERALKGLVANLSEVNKRVLAQTKYAAALQQVEQRLAQIQSDIDTNERVGGLPDGQRRLNESQYVHAKELWQAYKRTLEDKMQALSGSESTAAAAEEEKVDTGELRTAVSGLQLERLLAGDGTVPHKRYDDATVGALISLGGLPQGVETYCRPVAKNQHTVTKPRPYKIKSNGAIVTDVLSTKHPKDYLYDNDNLAASVAYPALAARAKNISRHYKPGRSNETALKFLAKDVSKLVELNKSDQLIPVAQHLAKRSKSTRKKMMAAVSKVSQKAGALLALMTYKQVRTNERDRYINAGEPQLISSVVVRKTYEARSAAALPSIKKERLVNQWRGEQYKGVGLFQNDKYSAAAKLQLVDKLIDRITTGEWNANNCISEDEMDTMFDGRLGEIVTPLRKSVLSGAYVQAVAPPTVS